jgi:hypothetical protein
MEIEIENKCDHMPTEWIEDETPNFKEKQLALPDFEKATNQKHTGGSL